MPTEMKYETSGAALPCDRCGLQTKMHTLLQSTDGGGTWEPVQYRNPRTKKDRDARYCEACAKEVCGIFPPVSWAKARAAMETLARVKEAEDGIADIQAESKDAKQTVLRYLVQNDADQLSHAGCTAKFRTRSSSTLDKDFLADVLTEEQLREATRTSESQFVQIS